MISTTLIKEEISEKTGMLDIKGIAFVALSLVIIGLGSLFKVWPVLIFFAIWLSNIVQNGRLVLSINIPLLVIISFLGLCFFSTFWSFDPVYTLYNSTMFLACSVCILIMSTIVETKNIMIGLAIGFFIVLLVTLLSGNYADIYGTNEQALRGFFGNKNVVGHYASISALVSFCFICFSWEKKTKLALLVFVALLVFSLICMILSRSATSAISLVFVFLSIGGLAAVTKFPLGLRVPILLLIGLAVVGVVLALYGFEINVIEKILNAFGKNSTLTGRTWLWSEALERIKETYTHGYGYQGFWRPGQYYAEYHWKMAQFKWTKGFHFHNLLLETGVQLGILGLLVMVVFVGSAFARVLYLIIRNGMDLQLAFLYGIVAIHMIRAISEVDLLGPFTLGSFLFYMTYIKLWMPTSYPKNCVVASK